MIILVRHGQTAANAERRLQGRVDLPLTELGRRQAQAAASLVPPGAAVVSSPLRRAVETAELLGAGGSTISVDDRWTELDYGVYDGNPLGAVPPDVWDRWRSDPDWAPPRGESLHQCGVRVRAACGELRARIASDGQPVVVVSHVSPIKAAVAWALGADDTTTWRMFLDVAAACRVAIGPRGPSLVSFNERTHLVGVL